jgi:hypothetical protein
MPARMTRDQRDRLLIEEVRLHNECKDAEEALVEAKAKRAWAPDEFEAAESAMREARRREREFRQTAWGVKPSTQSGAQPVMAAMNQWMWLEWYTIAVDAERKAEAALERVVGGDIMGMREELWNSLIGVSGAASCVDSLSVELEYLYPRRAFREPTSSERIAAILGVSLGVQGFEADALGEDLRWLFDRRNEGIHPYSRLEPVLPHPSGANTSAVFSSFNAFEATAALDCATRAWRYCQNPPQAGKAWVSRWSEHRRPVFEQMEDLNNERAKPLR